VGAHERGTCDGGAPSPPVGNVRYGRRVTSQWAYCRLFLRALSTSSTGGSAMVTTIARPSAKTSTRLGALKTPDMAGGSPSPGRRMKANVIVHLSIGRSCFRNRHLRAAPSAAVQSRSGPDTAFAPTTSPEAAMVTSTCTSPLSLPPDGRRGYPGVAISSICGV
jgi:hypothetical protein